MSIRKATPKILVVLVAVVTTHFATKNLMTSRLFAQYFTRKQQKLPANPGITLTRITSEEAVATRKFNLDRPFDSRLVNESMLVESMISPIPGQIQFHAKVKVGDSDLNMRYMWSIRVVSADNPNLVFTRHYDHQNFTVPESHQATVSFDDSIPFEPGKYKVALDLYRLKAGLDFTKMHDKIYAGPSMVVRAGKTVLVE